MSQRGDYGGAMTAHEQTSAFAKDIDKLVHRYREEFDLNYASAIGVLFMKAHALSEESAEEAYLADEDEKDAQADLDDPDWDPLHDD